MKFVALIPARSGSKGIPGKNLQLLDGSPLITYTIKAALSSFGTASVFVSTDSSEIAELAKSAGAQVPFLRPKGLAGDTSSACEVVEHFIDWTHSNTLSLDAIVYLQPTSPLRSAASISSSCKLFDQSKADSLVSVVPVPHQYTPSSLMLAEGQWLKPVESFASAPLRRQEKPAFFARNGPTIVITKPETISKHGNLYGEKILKFEMNQEESVDIDSIEDLDYAAWMIERRAES